MGGGRGFGSLLSVITFADTHSRNAAPSREMGGEQKKKKRRREKERGEGREDEYRISNVRVYNTRRSSMPDTWIILSVERVRLYRARAIRKEPSPRLGSDQNTLRTIAPCRRHNRRIRRTYVQRLREQHTTSSTARYTVVEKI